MNGVDVSGKEEAGQCVAGVMPRHDGNGRHGSLRPRSDVDPLRPRRAGDAINLRGQMREPFDKHLAILIQPRFEPLARGDGDVAGQFAPHCGFARGQVVADSALKVGEGHGVMVGCAGSRMWHGVALCVAMPSRVTHANVLKRSA